MGKNVQGAAAVLIAAALVGTPVIAEVNSRGEELKATQQELDVAAAEGVTLRADLAATESDLFWSNTVKELTSGQLKRSRDELAGARQEIDKLKRDVAAARAERPAARLAAKPQPKSVKVKASVGATGNCESWRGLVADHFPPSQVNNALLTMRRESGCRANAVNPNSPDYGLFQINFPSHKKRVSGNAKALLDPNTNVRVAAQIWRESGWCPWVAVRGILC